MNQVIIPKLAASRSEQNAGPMTYLEWKEQRQLAANQLYQALPGPVLPPLVFEAHPYKMKYQPLMPKRPKCYLIGTAPPATYLCGKAPAGNKNPILIDGKRVVAEPGLEFYHGNRNSLWSALRFPCGTPQQVLSELNCRNIRYDDILFSWSRKDFSSADDKHLTDIIPNVDLLMDLWDRRDRPFLWFTNSRVFNKPGVNIYLKRSQFGTRGMVKAHGGDLTAHNVFLRAWQECGARLWLRKQDKEQWVEVCAMNSKQLKSFRYLLRHELRIELDGLEREYQVLTGPSPSSAASRQMKNNPRFQDWYVQQAHPANRPTLKFRSDVYRQFMDWISAHWAD